MQLGSMVGTGHRRRCHANRRESRDVDFGGRPPNEDIDAGRPPMWRVMILVNDGVIRFTEMLYVLAIDLSDNRRSTHVLLPKDGVQWQRVSGLPDVADEDGADDRSPNCR